MRRRRGGRCHRDARGRAPSAARGFASRPASSSGSSSSRAQIERHYGRAQDIEWAIDRRLGEIFLLQSRAGDRLEPEAAAARPSPADPLAAIAATFLGDAATQE